MLTTKRFSELRAKMAPEARARVNARVAAVLECIDMTWYGTLAKKTIPIFGDRAALQVYRFGMLVSVFPVRAWVSVRLFFWTVFGF